MRLRWLGLACVGLACGGPANNEAASETSAPGSSSNGVSTAGSTGTAGSSSGTEASTSAGTGTATGSTSEPGSSSSDSSSGLPSSESTGGETCTVPWERTECTNPSVSPHAGCDPWNQDCVAGERCVGLYDDAGTFGYSCVPMGTEPAGLNAACFVNDGAFSGGDNCDVGLYCRAGAHNVGTCQPMCGCGPDSPTCPEGYICEGIVCSVSCDPLDSGCGASSACTPAQVGDLQAYACGVAQGSGEIGEPYANLEGEACATRFDCLPGAFCQDLVCRRYCDLDSGDSCPDARACEPQTGPPATPSCLENVGVCALPAGG